MSSKILQLKLIENGKKCKKIYEEDIESLKHDFHSAIDNLIKGGSGQAVQNMNLRFGFKEMEGIQ